MHDATGRCRAVQDEGESEVSTPYKQAATRDACVNVCEDRECTL